MRRGFKAEAERIAARMREQLGVSDYDSLDPTQLAAHMGVQVVAADILVPAAQLQDLELKQTGVFSAATFHLADGRVVAVTNPLNDLARTRSDLAHELAHLLLEHSVRELHNIGGYPVFTCDPEQEEEANWLAGCLLLPRPLLLQAARRGATPDDIAAAHHVSVPMARFRLNTSGVLLQARRGTHRGRAS